MAKIRLGDGEKYRHCDLSACKNGTRPEPPTSITISCSTPRGREQKNFPISLELDRDESLKLVASICQALMTPPPRQVKPVNLGRIFTAKNSG